MTETTYDPYIVRAIKEEIEELRAEVERLATQNARIDELRHAVEMERDYYKEMAALHIESLGLKSVELAAALAREQRLRDALEHATDMLFDHGYESLYCSKALATKPDDSALRAYVAKKQAKILWEKAAWFDEHDTDAAEHLRRMADELEAQFK